MPEDYKEWTHLAQAYVILGEHTKAINILEHGTLIQPSCWEIWRDILLISTNCKNYKYIITAYNSLLDLVDGYFYEESIKVLAQGVTEAVKNAQMDLASELVDDTLTLFGRVLAKKSSPVSWMYYGLVTAFLRDPTQEAKHETADHLYKCYTAMIEDKMWASDMRTAKYVLVTCDLLVDAYIDACAKFGPCKESVEMLKTLKVSIDSVTWSVRFHFTDVLCRITPELINELESLEAKGKLVEDASEEFKKFSTV